MRAESSRGTTPLTTSRLGTTVGRSANSTHCKRCARTLARQKRGVSTGWPSPEGRNGEGGLLASVCQVAFTTNAQLLSLLIKDYKAY